jgi:DNA-binding CsgD family transcriptional regulator
VTPRRRRPRKPLSPDSTARERALDALALARRGHSLREAAALARTDPRTVRRHVGSAFRRDGGRWVPTPFDRIPRQMNALTRNGPVAVTVRDSRAASLLGEHLNAVATYIETGDEAPLRKLRRRSIRIRGRPIVLETDPIRLDRLAAGGELAYELYRF